jgi:hypothetical protein
MRSLPLLSDTLPAWKPTSKQDVGQSGGNAARETHLSRRFVTPEEPALPAHDSV